MGLGLSDIIGGILSPVKEIIGEVVVDPNKRNEINLKLEELADQADARLSAEMLAQIEVNKEEAKSGSFWVAGARPFIIWVGGCSMAYSAIVYPFLMWGSRIFGYVGDFPQVDNNLITTVTLGVLGLGTQRMMEKKWGVSTNDMRSLPTDPVVRTITPIAGPVPEVKKKKHFGLF